MIATVHASAILRSDNREAELAALVTNLEAVAVHLDGSGAPS